MNANEIKDLTLEVLQDTPIQAKAEKAFALYEKAQMSAMALANINSEEDLTVTKIGTVLSLNLFGLLLGGTKPKDITQEDWKSIAKEVTEKAILMYGQSYSVYIFDLYSDYINHSADVLEMRVPEDKRRKYVDALKNLSEELQEKKNELLNGNIDEVRYTEDCLWISLDAMIKCMSSYVSCLTGEKAGEMIQAISSLAFEYGRLTLYRKEQALLDEYIQNQYELDDQLQVKFDAFKRELDEETQRFKALIDKAFEPGFRDSLVGSVELARAVGVNEDEILKSIEDIDNFFM